MDHQDAIRIKTGDHKTLMDKQETAGETALQNLLTVLPIPAGKRAKTSNAERFDVTTLEGFARALTACYLSQGTSIGRADVIAAWPHDVTTEDKRKVTHAIQQAENAKTQPTEDELNVIASDLSTVIVPGVTS